MGLQIILIHQAIVQFVKTISKTISITDSGHSKNRFSVGVDISAEGSINKALVLIARRTIPKSWIIPDNLLVYPSEIATMSKYTMKQYISDY